MLPWHNWRWYINPPDSCFHYLRWCLQILCRDAQEIFGHCYLLQGCAMVSLLRSQESNRMMHALAALRWRCAVICNVSCSRLRHAHLQLAWVITFLCDRTALIFTACKPKLCVGMHIAYMTCSSLSFSPSHSLEREWLKWWNNNMWCSAYIHTRIHTYIHTYMHRRTYIYTYIHT